MSNRFKVFIGLFLILCHLSIIISLIVLRIIGYYLKDEFTTLIGIVTPIFAGFTTSIILFIINNITTAENAPPNNNIFSKAFKVLVITFSILLTLSLLIPIWLNAYHLGFDDFEDFKSFILIMDGLFSVYTGYLVYSIYPKQ